MTRLHLSTALFAAVVGFVAVAPKASADEWNKKTIITVNEPLAIPGMVLQPGKYVMKLADTQADRHIVQVFNEDESKILDTIVAIPNYRLEPTDKTQFGFWEMPSGQPHALKAWFYPGDNFGQEFAYPKEIATNIAQTNNQNVPTTSTDNSNQIAMTTPSGQTENCNCGASSSASNATAQPSASTPAQSNAGTATAESQATTGSTGTADMGSTRTGTGTPAPENNPNAGMNENNTIAQNQPPQSQTSSSAAATTNESTSTNAGMNQTAANANRSLPRTASPYPLVGFAGLLSLGAAWAARAARKRA